MVRDRFSFCQMDILPFDSYRAFKSCIIYYIIFLNSNNKSKNKVDLPNIDFDGIGGNAGASGRAAVWVMNIGMMTKSTVRLTTTLLASITCLWLALSI